MNSQISVQISRAIRAMSALILFSAMTFSPTVFAENCETPDLNSQLREIQNQQIPSSQRSSVEHDAKMAKVRAILTCVTEGTKITGADANFAISFLKDEQDKEFAGGISDRSSEIQKDIDSLITAAEL